MNEQAYQWLRAWFIKHYEDPAEACPYDSSEGGYQYIWGGPFETREVLVEAWDGVFSELFLEQAAERLEDEFDCLEWSGVPITDSDEEDS